MKEDFAAYLRSLGMMDILVKRVEVLFDSYIELSKDEIKGIFVTDSGLGSVSAGKGFGSLWFFTEKFLIEMKYFATTNDFDMVPLKNHINHLEISRRDYDFTKASEKSTLSVRLSFGNGTTREAHGTKDNCNHLKDVLVKHVLPNIKLDN